MLISGTVVDATIVSGPEGDLDQAEGLRRAVRAAQIHDERATAGDTIRHELVRRIRQRIAGGHYITQDKIDRCVDRLLAEFLTEPSVVAARTLPQRARRAV
jgi:hypothetical protein